MSIASTNTEIRTIRYPDVPLDHNGICAVEYSWFIVEGYGFSLYHLQNGVDLICVYQDPMEMIAMMMAGEKKDVREVLEIVIGLYHWGNFID